MNKWDLLLENELKKKTINLNQFVVRCCYGQDTDPHQIIKDLLSVDDENDIINGMITAEELRLHIEVWIANGKQKYSGK